MNYFFPIFARAFRAPIFDLIICWSWAGRSSARA